jgi:hypothetical protein
MFQRKHYSPEFHRKGREGRKERLPKMPKLAKIAEIENLASFPISRNNILQCLLRFSSNQVKQKFPDQIHL